MDTRLTTDLVLLINGVVVLLMVLLSIKFLRDRRRENQFRDDLWESWKRSERHTEEEIHRKIDSIALEAPATEEESTEKIHSANEGGAATDTKTDTISRGGAQGEKREAPRVEKAPFRPPNFRGKPHEILGIDENANKDIVVAAYKYWIKRYHPDRVQHLGIGYVLQANRRAEQLNEAKTQLLRLRGD